MPNSCQHCELDIRPFKQISQQEIDLLKEHMDVTDSCEECLLSTLGQIEYPNK